MAIEEPSVIAACSSIAKIIGEKGSGFKATSTPPVMIAQIQILEIQNYKEAEYNLILSKKEIIQFANESCQSMVRRGGGVEGLRFKKLGE